MTIKSVEVICKSCAKCRDLEPAIREMIKSMALQNKIVITFDFKHNQDLRALEKFSLGPAQTPALLINGQVEFAGRVDRINLKRRLEIIHKMG